MRRKKTIIITVMCVAILFMAVGYALLSSRLDITGSTAVTSTWRVEFSSIRTVSQKGGATNKIVPEVSATTAKFEVDLVQPGDEITYEIDITNFGDIDAEIKGATYTVTGSEAIYITVDGVRKGTLIGSCEGLNVCPTVYLTLKVGYDPSVSKDPTEKTKDIVVTLDIGQYVETNPTPDGELIPELVDDLTLVQQILSDNVVQSDISIDFSQISSDTNGKGLYFTSKNTEGNMPTYYFRGEVDNNYVDIGMTKDNGSCTYNGEKVQAYINSTFVDLTDEASCETTSTVCVTGVSGGASMLVGVDQSTCEVLFAGTLSSNYPTWTPNMVHVFWRIVRINEDGSVRLMYNDSIGKHNFNTTAATSTTPYIANDNAHVGYMYGTAGSTTYEATHANINDSTVKTVLDDWYEINLKTDYADYLVDAGFCNDRSKAPKPNLWRYNQYFQDSALGYGQNMTIYGAYNRLSNNKAPQFACPQTNDLFTTNTSSKGNKALDYPIGLITADEVMYAGKNNNYMCNGNSFLTMSPSEYYLNFSQYYMGCNLSDFITSYDSTGLFDVRPVVNIKGNIAVLSGNGTSDNPYVLNLE